MAATEREKMIAGEWYNCVDDELESLRAVARRAVFEHNSLHPDERGDIGPALTALLAAAGREARIEAPFHCAYGFNIALGDGVFLNAGCVILDTAPVRIGADAIVAAGSAVSRDVADGELRLVRAEQLVKPGWADRFHDAMKKKKAEKKG